MLVAFNRFRENAKRACLNYTARRDATRQKTAGEISSFAFIRGVKSLVFRSWRSTDAKESSPLRRNAPKTR